MIEYEIVVNHKRDQKPARKVVEPTDSDFKTVVFQRQLRACNYKDEDRVKIRGTNTRGIILRIEEDVNRVNWVNNRPMFVQVRFDNGEVKMCNPNQIKRSKI